jgi:hypothetical protein
MECGSGVLALPYPLGRLQLPLSFAAVSSCRGGKKSRSAVARKEGRRKPPLGYSMVTMDLRQIVLSDPENRRRHRHQRRQQSLRAFLHDQVRRLRMGLTLATLASQFRWKTPS